MHVGFRVIVAILGWAAYDLANALSCAPPRPREVQVSEAKHIFVARVRAAALSRDETRVEAELVIEEVVKGDASKVPVIWVSLDPKRYDSQGASADFGPQGLLVGPRYLVYAAMDGPVQYMPCAPIYLMERRDSAQLAKLRELVAIQAKHAENE